MAIRALTLCRNVLLNSSRFQPISADLSRNVWSLRKCRNIFHLGPKSGVFGVLGVGIACATIAVKQTVFDETSTSTSFPSSSTAEARNRSKFKPIRKVISDTDNSNLKLTLYQYQSCPFCCKVKAFLDFHGFSYDVIEVNSLRRTEIKWSIYKKVPILVCESSENPNEFVQMNDSSLIVSVLESFLEDRTVSVEQLVTYYPPLESVNQRGKKDIEYPNKYFIMYGSRKPAPPEREDERKWRKWTDDILVHTISPNIYRTPSESVQSFRFFSDVGDWKKAFNAIERAAIIYVGATVMFVIGKILKKRHSLKDDVRISMYDACNEWTAALSNRKTTFMGGSSPNLADLAVYGVLSSVEGCTAFHDLVDNTNISDWFSATKKAIEQNAGRREE